MWESFSQAVIYRWSDPDQAASAPLPLTLFLSLFLLFTESFSLVHWLFFSREVKQEALSEPAGQVAMELEGRSHSESAMQQSDQQGAESSDSHPEEVRRPTERRPSGNYNPEIWQGENWSLWGSSRLTFWSQSDLKLSSFFRFSSGLDIRLLLPLFHLAQ